MCNLYLTEGYVNPDERKGGWKRSKQTTGTTLSETQHLWEKGGREDEKTSISIQMTIIIYIYIYIYIYICKFAYINLNVFVHMGANQQYYVK